VGALAGSALGVAVEPEHYTRLVRMFPDGLTDFWTVDLPERPKGRGAATAMPPPAVPGRAALEYASMVATARSLARQGARLVPSDLMDALVDSRRGVGTAAGNTSALLADADEQPDADGNDARLLRRRTPPAGRRASSPYTDLATEALSTAAAAPGAAPDPAALAALAEAAMARGVARTAPTASVRPQRREFGAHDFGLTAAGVAAPLGLAYQYAPPGLLAAAVDAAVAATHPDPAGRDGAAIVAAAVAWLARRGQREQGWRRRRRWQQKKQQEGVEKEEDDHDHDEDASSGPRELAEHLLSIAPVLRLGDEAREVLAMVAGALGVEEQRQHHPLGRGGAALAGIVPPALDASPGRWRVFWASPEWAALSASVARVSGGPFATSGVRLAGLALLLVGAAGFGSARRWPNGSSTSDNLGNPAAQAVSLAVTMGGACAAQASVVGAMVGALHGVAWVPRRWWRELEDVTPDDAARARRAWDGVGRGAAAVLGAALGGAAVEAAVADGLASGEDGEDGEEEGVVG
jgi:hypothetical protein